MLSKDIEHLLTKHEKLSLKKIMNQTHESVFGFLLVVLSLPSALPVPAPGYSIPFGIAIIILSVQIIFGKKVPWFPDKIKNKELSIEKFKTGLQKINKFITFFEHLVKPRFSWIHKKGSLLLGLLILLCGISMLIPIPGTNTIPALGVFVIALGMIEEDGLMEIIGVLVALVGLAITGIILFYGKEFLDLLIQQATSIL